MKYLGILFFWLFNLNYASAQTVISSCIAPDSVFLKYKKSAEKLAVNRCLKIGDTYKDSISINKQFSDQYIGALFAVYNATSLLARDTVIELINVVKDYVCPPDLNSIYIKADSTKLWVKNIRNDISPSGNTQIDYLIQKYFLKKTAYFHTFNTSLYHIISFETDSNCHINRLCDKFGSLFSQGVNAAGPNNSNKSEGLNITDSINVNFIELTYSYSWGDCISGCNYSRFWKFRINNNCSVEYKGSNGDPLPEYIFTNLKKITSPKNEVKLYPNPFNEKLNFELLADLKKNMEVTIVNSIGYTVYSQNDLSKKHEIDLSFLPSGIYFLKLQSGSEQKVFKIVRE